MSDAECRYEEPALFFDEFEFATLEEKIKVVKMCTQCSVREECEQYGRSFANTHGIFGGYFFKNGKPKDPFKIRKPQKEKQAA